MGIVLGDGPDRLTVKLSRHGDFVAALIYDDNDPNTVNAWPAGATIELRFYATTESADPAATWPATITGDRAEWHKNKTFVASEVLVPGLDTARLFYTTPAGVELEWAQGAPRAAP